MLNILFIGDINGKIGREAVKLILPKLKKELKIDLVIANGENLAHGKGINETSVKEMLTAGLDWLTNGDHAFANKLEVYDRNLPILRPANYSSEAPGQGYTLINVGNYKILLINLIGRVFMPMDYDCPFSKLEEILAKFANKNISAIIIDIHAEATSEKVAFSHFADGKVSAIIGTHTHVLTADAKIFPAGTAYITDVGMTGLADGVIGVDKESIIKTFLTQIKSPHVLPEKGQAIFNAVTIAIDPATKQAKKIEPIIKFIDI